MRGANKGQDRTLIHTYIHKRYINIAKRGWATRTTPHGFLQYVLLYPDMRDCVASLHVRF